MTFLLDVSIIAGIFGFEICETSQVEQHRREIYALDIWSHFACPNDAERSWYVRPWPYLRPRPILNGHGEWKMIPDYKRAPVPAGEWMAWYFKVGCMVSSDVFVT